MVPTFTIRQKERINVLSTHNSRLHKNRSVESQAYITSHNGTKYWKTSPLQRHTAAEPKDASPIPLHTAVSSSDIIFSECGAECNTEAS